MVPHLVFNLFSLLIIATTKEILQKLFVGIEKLINTIEDLLIK